MRTDRPLDDAENEPYADNVCPVCGYYWDSPNHYYGCPIAADALEVLDQELGA